MLSRKLVAAGLFACGASLAVAGALAAEPANQMSCLRMSRQVTDALNANQQSPNYEEAKDEKKTGLEYCQTGLFDRGLEHYANALKLLGVAPG